MQAHNWETGTVCCQPIIGSPQTSAVMEGLRQSFYGNYVLMKAADLKMLKIPYEINLLCYSLYKSLSPRKRDNEYRRL